MVGVGIITFLVLSFIVKSDGKVTYDLLDLRIPTPPLWTSYIPYIGPFIEFLFQFFSIHGLITLTVAGVISSIGLYILELGGEKRNEKEKTKLGASEQGGNQKKDFGIYMKGQTTNPNTSIHIVDPFTIVNLVLYPDNSSSITGAIDNMLITFDFDDGILKVFIYALSQADLITESDLNQRLREQTSLPIIYDFSEDGVNIVGMVLTCKYGQITRSQTTNEEFVPLIIETAKIVQEPAAILFNTKNHG